MEAGLEYIFSPIVLILLVITVVSVAVGIRQAKSILAEGDVKYGSKRAPFIFLSLIMGYFIVTYWNASQISDRLMGDKIIPMVVSIVAIICCLVLLVRMIRQPETDMVFADREADGDDADAAHGLWPTLAWFAGLLILSGLFGFIIALAIFLISFFRIRAGENWSKSAILTAIGIAFICFMAWTLNRDFPPGLLQDYVELPWPLGGA